MSNDKEEGSMSVRLFVAVAASALLIAAYRRIGWIWQAKPERQDIADRLKELPDPIKKARV